MQTLLSKHWHHLPSADVLEFLETDPENGLGLGEVANRQIRFGPNALTEVKGKGPLLLFLLQFHQPLIYILLTAALITASLKEWVDSGVIMGVVLINAVVGFVQESKALKAIEALARLMTSEAVVIREGEKGRIPARDLVPGDVVLLSSGDKVPADLRLFSTWELQVDESAMTGESVPVCKQLEKLAPETVLADRTNMAYASTLVTYGTGTGIVTSTGDNTEVGQISELISSAQVLATPLTQKIAKFSLVLLYAILTLSAVTFSVGILRGVSLYDMFMATVALAIGAIPEGLPAAVTVIMAMGVSRMARRHAIIRKLPAVETLGSTTVICSDKTGTLTQNQMTVQEVWTDGASYFVSGIGYAPEGTFTQSGVDADPSGNAALLETLKAGLLCNESQLKQTEDGWQVEGDPTEGALITSAYKAGLSAQKLQNDLPRLDSIPFESQHQYMATLHDCGQNRSRIVFLKGSIESLLPKCDAVFGTTEEGKAPDTALINRKVGEMAARGLRVLALARMELPPGTTSISHDDVASGLTFAGLQGMLDPPRLESIAAVQACQRAGIRVKMITGDHAGTAEAIARKIGLEGMDNIEGEPVVTTGEAIAKISGAELIEVAERSSVFARVAPEQKLRLVEALQSRGHIVAMTGDGVNDAPALRRANIGVAMGVSGTEVSKEAADMVLTDDNFASIEAAVEEGRGVFDNLLKFITWTLPTNLGEGLVIMVAIVAGVALPILPVQILWINMTTAGFLGLMLAFEPKEPGIMTRPPRDPKRPLLSGVMVFRIAMVGVLLTVGAFVLFEWALLTGASDAVARTLAVNVFVIGELFYLFNCRSLTRSIFAIGFFTNPWILLGASASFVMQLFYTYSPTMNRLFYSAPISLLEWLYVFGFGFTIYVVVGVEKWARNRLAGPPISARQQTQQSIPQEPG